MSWKLLKSVSGTNAISVSDVIEKAREFLCEVKFKGSTTAYLFESITIPKDAEKGTRIIGYHYSGSYNGAIGIYYNKITNVINVDENWYAVAGNNGSVTDVSLTVYWR